MSLLKNLPVIDSRKTKKKKKNAIERWQETQIVYRKRYANDLSTYENVFNFPHRKQIQIKTELKKNSPHTKLANIQIFVDQSVRTHFHIPLL
jgi:hypothetical protein